MPLGQRSPRDQPPSTGPRPPFTRSTALQKTRPSRRRILVIGTPGAGKSTLAAGLGAALDLPVVHLDALFWKPGWRETPRDEFRALTAELIKREEWVIDGHYGSSLDLRLPAADTVILLDLPRALCIWRVTRRWLTHIGRTRPDMGPGCPEKIDWEFIKWIWDFPRSHMTEAQRQLRELPESTRVYHLHSRREIDRFLAAVRAGEDPPGRLSPP